MDNNFSNYVFVMFSLPIYLYVIFGYEISEIVDLALNAGIDLFLKNYLNFIRHK